jgi:hypothetical protein
MSAVRHTRRRGLPLALGLCLALVACDGGSSGSGAAGDAEVLPPQGDIGADGDVGGNITPDVGLLDSIGPDTVGPDGGAPDDGAVIIPDPDTGSGPDLDAAAVPDEGPTPTPEGPVDPECTDGQYTETLPTPNVSIDGLKASYSASDVNGFILSVLDARFPVGAYIVEQALIHGGQLGDCVAYFAYDTSTAEKVIDTLSTVVHECGHFLDIGLGGWTDDVFVITDTLSFQCSGGDKFEYGGNTFPRSELMNDSYAALRPMCAQGQWNGCDSYADIYLTGDSGNQGFSSLMEETVQYVNSLAAGYAYSDQSAWTVSGKDGILTFLWYMERYLQMARTLYPDTHAFILGDACYRELILTTWGRAWLFLSATEDISKLGMEDDVLEALVMDPSLLGEIDLVREAQGCP